MRIEKNTHAIVFLIALLFVAIPGTTWADSDLDDLDDLDELVVMLYHADFAAGTLQIAKADTYILTDSKRVRFKKVTVRDLEAGLSFAPTGGPNADPDAIGIHVGPDIQNVVTRKENIYALTLTAFGSTFDVLDELN